MDKRGDGLRELATVLGENNDREKPTIKKLRLKRLKLDLGKTKIKLSAVLRLEKDELARFSAADAAMIFESDGGKCDVRLEIATALSIERMLVRLAKMGKDFDQDLSVFLKSMLPRVLKRIEGVAFTVGLTAYLRGLRNEWQNWAQEWHAPPKPRNSTKTLMIGTIAAVHPADYSYLHKSSGLLANRPHYKARRVRHLPEPCGIIRKVVKEQICFLSGAKTPGYSLGFRTLFQAIRDQGNSPNKCNIYFATGGRGSGKGALFEDLARYGDYLLSPDEFFRGNGASAPPKRYVAAYFGSFVFSSEAAPVWEALIEFLQNPYLEPALEPPAEKPKLGRIQRLEQALELKNVKGVLKRAAEDINKPGEISLEVRALVVLHGFELLLDTSGEPKNSEIRLILMALLDRQFSDLPIDLVLISRTDRIMTYFKYDYQLASQPGEAQERIKPKGISGLTRKSHEQKQLKLLVTKAVRDNKSELALVARRSASGGVNMIIEDDAESKGSRQGRKGRAEKELKKGGQEEGRVVGYYYSLPSIALPSVGKAERDFLGLLKDHRY